MSTITDLADRQLAAYNASDLDAFCACYHAEVQVRNGDELTIEGIESFRQKYRPMFSTWRFGADVPSRLSLGEHCVDYEHYWRIDPETDERTDGEVLVRYTERDGQIGRVQFLR